MLQGWVVIAVALAYIGLLFLVASYGDRTRGLRREDRARLLIYPLSLAIYCTSWTFFGSVGSVSRTGYDFLTIYIGPVLMIGLFSPLLMRIVRLAKAQNIGLPPQKWSRLNVSPRPVFETGDQSRCLGNGSLQNRSSAS